MKKTAQTLIFAFVAVFLVLSLTKNFFSYTDKAKFYSDLENEYNKENNHNKQLKSDLKRSSDYYYIERQIREKLNRLQPDETAVIIPQITPTETPTPEAIRSPAQEWTALLLRR